MEFFKKKDKVSNSTMTLEDKTYGNLHEGFNEEQEVVVNIVSRKKYKKSYQVGGVLDQEKSNNWKGWLYLAPVLILISVFLLYPLINTIAISFIDDYSFYYNGGSGFTFDNFLIVLGLKEISPGTGVYQTNFIQYAVPNTFFITFVTVPITIVLALLIAVMLNKIKWFQKIYQTIFFLPYATNAIAVGMVFSVMFDNTGLINSLFGSSIRWITGADRWIAMIPLCLNIIWSGLPFKILILLSGLQNVDKQYYQAAKIDSTPQWKVLLRITVPALSPQLLYLMVTSFIDAFKEYTAVIGLFNASGTMGPGSYNMYTVVYYIYDNLTSNTSYAAAAAVLLFIVILIFTFFQLWLSKKKANY